MTRRFLFAVSVCICVLPAGALAQNGAVAEYGPCCAAFYSAGPAFTGEQRLIIFEGGKNTAEIRLPFALGRSEWSPDGRSLYAERMWSPRHHDPQGLYRIQFNPIRVSAVPTSSVKPYNSIAISAAGGRLLVSGEDGAGPTRVCGVFDIAPPRAEVKQILNVEDCRYVSAWVSLSLAPDGKRAVGIHHRGLAVIDVADGKTHFIGEGYVKAAWSPDGRWIAALRDEGDFRTVLFDTAQFKIGRTLPASEAVWSPDSKYLLSVTAKGCGDEDGTFETINISTGQRTLIESSKCKVYQTTAAWISPDLLP